MNVAADAVRTCVRCQATYWNDRDIYCPPCDVEVTEIDIARGIELPKTSRQVAVERVTDQLILGFEYSARADYFFR